LFPFSPLVTGFNKQEYRRAIIYYQSADISGFGSIDSLMKEAEQFHGLSFTRKVEIFICDSDRQFHRYTGSTARFITELLYGRIFVSARAVTDYENQRIHLETYLKHELSHSLLYQNMSLLHSLQYPGWFMEGLATYSAGQMGVDGYLTPGETAAKMKEGYFVEPKDWGTIISPKGKTIKEIEIDNKFLFIYAEFALIISDLIQTQGENRFWTFLHRSLQQEDFYELFSKTFGIDFESYIKKFSTVPRK
jgi:hypothetical protein